MVRHALVAEETNLGNIGKLTDENLKELGPRVNSTTVPSAVAGSGHRCVCWEKPAWTMRVRLAATA
jgi:hypothetical protein